MSKRNPENSGGSYGRNKTYQKIFWEIGSAKDVSLNVNDGQVVVILGPSGSGKTTLLRCLNFLEYAESGEIKIGDTKVGLQKAKRQQRQDSYSRVIIFLPIKRLWVMLWKVW